MGPTRDGAEVAHHRDARDPSARRFSLLGAVNLVLRSRRWVILLAVGGAVGGAVFGWRTRGYVAESRFAPSVSAEDASRLSALAAQFGVQVGSGSGDESVEFYGELVKSRSVLTDVARQHFTIALDEGKGDSVQGDLMDFLVIDSEKAVDRERKAVEALQKRLTVQEDLTAGIVTVKLRMPWSDLAEQASQSLLDNVNAFNVARLRTRARAERAFVEERMRRAEDELQSAEAELQRFVESNRAFDDASRIAFEAARLERHVDLKQQVYVTLAQAYEQAAIQEVRDTPVITVVDSPAGSALPTGGILIFLGLGGGLGAFVGVAIGVAREYLDSERLDGGGDYEEYVALREQVRAGLKRWTRRLGAPWAK